MVRPVESKSQQVVTEFVPQGDFLGRCVKLLPTTKDFFEFIMINNPKAALVASVTILCITGSGEQLASVAGVCGAVEAVAVMCWGMHAFD